MAGHGLQEEGEVEVPRASPRHNAQRSGASPEEIAAAVDLILGAKRSDGKWEILWEIHTIEPKVPVDQL